MEGADSSLIIEYLSLRTFSQALNLIKKTFQITTKENPELELKESIFPGTFSAELEKYGILEPKYWILMSSEKELV